MSNEVEELGALDSQLLELAADDLSATEISERLGGAMSPEKIALRIKAILNERRGFLDRHEQQVLLIHDMVNLKKKAYEMLDGYDGVKALGPLVSLMKQIGDRYDIMAKEAGDYDGQITRRQAKEWIKAMELVYEAVVERLSAKYPEVDVIVLQEMINEEMPLAFARVEELAARAR